MPSFEIPSSVATNEVTSNDGMPARGKHTFHSQLPFQLQTKLPTVLAFGDTLRIPLVLKNRTPFPITGALTLKLPKFLKPVGQVGTSLNLKADDVLSMELPCVVLNEAGTGTLSIGFDGGNYSDSFSE